MSYVVMNQIGDSPIGEIFQGCDFQTQQKLSILQIDTHLRQENYDANWRSLERTFSLQQRNLERVVDSDKESGRIFLEERGQSMKDLLQGPDLRIPQRIVRSIIYDILVLLVKFQEQRFIHGDIRPENLLLPVSDDQSPIRLAYSSGVYYGKELIFSRRNRKYIAPEMLNPRFGTISPATDLYCLAFSCLELLFGNDFNYLFSRIGPDGNAHWTVLHGNSGEQLPPLRSVFPGIDYDLLYFFYTVTYRKVTDRPRCIRQFYFEMQNRYVLHQILLHLRRAEEISKQQIRAFRSFCHKAPLLKLLQERTGTRNPPDKKRIAIILSEATNYLRTISVPDYVINSLTYSVKPFVRPERYDVTLEFQADLEASETGDDSDESGPHPKSEYEFAPGFQTKTNENEKTASHRDELVSNLTGREVVEVQKQEPTLWETFLALFGKKKNTINSLIEEQKKKK